MLKKASLLAVFATLLMAHGAMAETKWNGFTSLSPDGLPDDMTWSRLSNGYMSSGCNSLNELLGTQITCDIDHKSWQDFYKAELTHPSQENRVNQSPDNFCGLSAMYFFTDRMSSSDFLVCTKDPACKAEFLSKVKSITCTIEASPKDSTIKVENGVMTFALTRKPDGEVVNGDGWVREQALRLFPSYQKAWTSRHP